MTTEEILELVDKIEYAIRTDGKAVLFETRAKMVCAALRLSAQADVRAATIEALKPERDPSVMPDYTGADTGDGKQVGEAVAWRWRYAHVEPDKWHYCEPPRRPPEVASSIEALYASPQAAMRGAPRIYLASRYSRFREMQQYRDELEAAGFKVTSRWINEDHQIDDAGLSLQAKEAERLRFAQEDYDDLCAANCVISFTEAPRSSNSRGGRHVEYGVAIALRKRVIVVGHRENVFHCLPQVEFFSTWNEALAALSAQSAVPAEERG